MLTNNIPPQQLRKTRIFIRKVTPYIQRGELTSEIRGEILEFLKMAPHRGYLLYLFDSMHCRGIELVDPGLVKETVRFKMQHFYRINIGAYFPPREQTLRLLGPHMYGYGEFPELRLRCVIFGEEHLPITFEMFSMGTPVWQWVTWMAKQVPVDLYTETKYIPDEVYPMYEGKNTFTDTKASTLDYFAHLPVTDHYLRHHRCDIRHGFDPNMRIKISLLHYIYHMKEDYMGISKEQSKKIVELIKAAMGSHISLVEYLTGFSDDSSVFTFLFSGLKKMFPNAPMVDPEPLRGKIQKQISNLRVDKDRFRKAFISLYDGLWDSDLFGLDYILNSVMDCYILSRVLRTYPSGDIEISPSNYQVSYARNAVVYVGRNHANMYIRFMRAFGFSNIKTREEEVGSTLLFESEPFDY